MSHLDLENTVEKLEEMYGDLQSQYNNWRRKAEELNAAGEKPYRFIDAAFAESRAEFSEYCGMTEIISFDAMFWYERRYSGELREHIAPIISASGKPITDCTVIEFSR